MKNNPHLKCFKIHGEETVTGQSRSANTSKFYDTYAEAEQAARNCVRSSGKGIVIFEAIKVVRAAHPPIEVENIDDDLWKR